MFKIFFPFLSIIMLLGCTNSGRDETLAQKPSLERYLNVSNSLSESSRGNEKYEISEPNDVLTLRDAISLTLMNNPELKAHSYQVRADEARALQAGLSPNPELGVEVEEIGGSGGKSGFDAAETVISVSQLIELADKAQKRKKAASVQTELAEWDYKSKRLDVFTDVANAFVEVLGAQRTLSLNQELLALSEKVAETVSQRVEAGKDPPIEQDKANVLKAKLEIQHNQALQKLQSSREKLASFWSSESPVFTKVQGELELIEPVPAFSKLKKQLSKNPDIARWSAELDKADALIDLEESRSVQDITFSAGVKRFNESDDNSFFVGFSIPLPLYDRNQGNKLAAINDKLKTHQLQKKAKLQIYSQLSEAYSSLSNSYSQAVKTKQAVLSGARAAFQAAKEAYEQGKTEYLAVLDSQRTLFQAESYYIDSLVSYHKAKANIERLTGQTIQMEK
ncbi:Cation efflux system protein CzcC [Sedimentisphaera cyanobacteriorum]|uniref:Cation efflux system protein CzcC n=1 Tax=Sedimentisphaera cyanobacteriorum TaxID=1940790 RepID=A0A1Q2HRW9_9BACT|nr:TolC family protein [Sedimentisphaera cyanobacteriorum]AQQ10172.1 Cation efflux system protein CzcC [Sedimentisphaera cyanobacteriorum]